MIIYNVTIKVEASIAEEWLQWLKNQHIPDVMACGCFRDFTLARLLDMDDDEGPTFTVQYRADSRDSYEHYIKDYAPEMRRRSFDRWGDRFIAFRTLMEVVH